MLPKKKKGVLSRAKNIEKENGYITEKSYYTWDKYRQESKQKKETGPTFT